jgi:MFS family permease
MSRKIAQLLLLVVTDMCVLAIGRALSPLQETMQAALSLSDNQIALLQGPALGLPNVLLAVPLGFLIDRHSRVRLCFILTIVGAVGTLMTALASSLVVLFIARALAGLAMTAVTIAIFSLVADLYEPAQRGRAKAVIVVGQNAATALVFAIGGRLLTSDPSPDSWRYAVVWLTVPAVLVVSVLMIFLREPARSDVVIHKPSSREAFREVWRYRALVVPITAGIVLAELSVYALLTWASPALSRHFSLAPDRVGSIMGAIMLASGIAGPLLGGVLADVCQRTGGPRRTFIAVSLLVLAGAPAGLFAIVPGLTAAGLMLALYNTIVAASVGMGITLFTIVIPNEIRGLCLAFMAAVDSLFAYALGPVLVSVTSGAVGGRQMIGTALAVVCAAASLGCAAAYALGTRAARREPARSDEPVRQTRPDNRQAAAGLLK